MNIYILNATVNGKLVTELLCDRCRIKGLITLDESGADSTPEYYDYTQFCKARSLACVKLKSYSFKDERDRKKLEQLDIDLIIIGSWQRLVPDWLISRCRTGIIGTHGSHEGISRGRGRSPQNWALMTGRKRFIMSVFWITEKADDGLIIDTREFEYTDTDSILTSYVKSNLCKADMLLENLNNGKIERKEGTPQEKDGRYLPQRIREDGKIDWNRSAADIYNMIRALTKPYPGAYTEYRGTEYVIWLALPVMMKEACLYDHLENGTVISILNESMLVKCGQGLLLVNECSSFDKISEGMVFESADYAAQIRHIIKRHKEKYGTPLSELVSDEVKNR